jgi:hypothetical protein
MPADIARPEVKLQFDRQVAAYLTQRVPNLAEGKTLMAEIDKAVTDCQAVIEEERRRLSTSLTTDELKELHATLEEQEKQLKGLRFERAMLADGLAKFERRPSAPTLTPSQSPVTLPPLPTAPIPVPATPVPAPTVSGTTAVAPSPSPSTLVSSAPGAQALAALANASSLPATPAPMSQTKPPAASTRPQ